MRNSKELELLGAEISKEYVENGVDLTESLRKQANNASLNQQQIKRVAECANVETYLKLAHLAKDGYVEFPLADAKQVVDDLSTVQKKEASHINEINLWEPLASVNTEKAEKFLGQEKLAVDNSIISFNEVSDKLLDIKRLENTVDFNYFNLIDKYAGLEFQVKQAMAGGNEISELKEVIKLAAPVNNELMIKDLTDNLKDIMPTQDFEKVGAIPEDVEVNRKTPIYKSAEAYEEVANTLHDEVIDLLNKKLQFANDVKDTEYRHYIKEAMAKTTLLEELAKLNPFKTKLRTGVTAAVVTLPVGASAGKKEEQYKQKQRMQEGYLNG
jgi:hypothetical protein